MFIFSCFPSPHIHLIHPRRQLFGRGVGGGGVAPGQRGDAFLPFEDAAQVVCPRKPAEVCDGVKVILPVKQQQLGSFQPGAGQGICRRNPHFSREHPHQVAFADPERCGQILNAVESHIIVADAFNRLGHNRAEPAGFPRRRGPACTAAHRARRRGRGPGWAAGSAVSIPAHRRASCSAAFRAGRAVNKTRPGQPFQKLFHRQAFQPQRQQMAGGGRPQRKISVAQQQGRPPAPLPATAPGSAPASRHRPLESTPTQSPDAALDCRGFPPGGSRCPNQKSISGLLYQ